MSEKMLAAGSRDEFGERLVQKQQISQIISQTLNEKDFTAISTPLIERESTFEQYHRRNIFHLYDQIGENLVLRPDLTLPIARFLAANRRQSQVTQLYYIGDVFRQTDHLSGAYNQETQAGIELIGDATFNAEMQALDTMLNFAEQFGIAEVQVVLSDARWIDTILKQLTMSEQQRHGLKEAIEAKNLTAFEKLRETIPDFPETLKRWPLAFGEDGEDVMWQLQSIPAAKKIIDNWLRLAEFVHQHYPEVTVTVDLAASSPQPYYTGAIMRGFIPSLGRYLFSGGRYDRLLENFQNETLPAVGMGLDIETILKKWRMAPTDDITREPIIVVLGKGRIAKDAQKLLKLAGIDTSPLDKPERKLIFSSPDGVYRFILVKPTDVIKYLDRGIGDIGIVGSDTMAEQDQNHYDMLDLETGQATFVVAAPPKFNLNATQRKRIATKYPTVTTQYFSKRGEDVEIIKLEGSVELGPLTNLSDAIVDITETGNTLRENNLVIYDKVAKVSTHLIIRSGALLQFQTELKRVIENMMTILGEKQNENYPK